MGFGSSLSLSLSLSLSHPTLCNPAPLRGSAKRVEENAAAASLRLTPEELAEVEAAVAGAAGTRYSESGMATTFLGRL